MIDIAVYTKHHALTVYIVYIYRLGPVNLKSFVDKILLRIGWKFELQHKTNH